MRRGAEGRAATRRAGGRIPYTGYNAGAGHGQVEGVRLRVHRRPDQGRHGELQRHRAGAGGQGARPAGQDNLSAEREPDHRRAGRASYSKSKWADEGRHGLPSNINPCWRPAAAQGRPVGRPIAANCGRPRGRRRADEAARPAPGGRGGAGRQRPSGRDAPPLRSAAATPPRPPFRPGRAACAAGASRTRVRRPRGAGSWRRSGASRGGARPRRGGPRLRISRRCTALRRI